MTIVALPWRQLALIGLTISMAVSCEKKPSSTLYEIIWSRVELPNSAFQLYRFMPPENWKRVDSGEPAAADSREPIAHYQLQLDGEQVDLTIHNFPIDTLDERIPPEAQIARWKQQIDEMNLSTVQVKPQAFGGFVGLLLQAEGIKQRKPLAMMAWTMQLAPQFYTALELLDTPEKHSFTRQLHADFTIKIVGSPSLLAREKEKIERSARTFALLDELPQPP